MAVVRVLHDIVHDFNERRGGRIKRIPTPPAVDLALRQPGDPRCLDANDVVNRSPPNVRKLCAHVLHGAEEYSEGQ